MVYLKSFFQYLLNEYGYQIYDIDIDDKNVVVYFLDSNNIFNTEKLILKHRSRPDIIARFLVSLKNELLLHNHTIRINMYKSDGTYMTNELTFENNTKYNIKVIAKVYKSTIRTKDKVYVQPTIKLPTKYANLIGKRVKLTITVLD